MQPVRARVPLLRGRLILRWRAVHGRDHAHVLKFQPIGRVHARGLIREPGPVQGRKNPVPGRIAGKLASRPIPSMGRGSQPDHRYSRLFHPETGDGPPPIGLVSERLLASFRNFFPPIHQARARPAHSRRRDQLSNTSRLRSEFCDLRGAGSYRRFGRGLISGPPGARHNWGGEKFTRSRMAFHRPLPLYWPPWIKPNHPKCRARKSQPSPVAPPPPRARPARGARCVPTPAPRRPLRPRAPDAYTAAPPVYRAASRANPAPRRSPFPEGVWPRESHPGRTWANPARAR